MPATPQALSESGAPEVEQSTLQPLPEYRSVLVAADASDHSNQGVADAVRMGKIWGATITGAHVYAAKLHDRRFRQMEGGLPEQFKEESELERQRDIHDDLITKGLSIITDSYLDEVESTCKSAQLNYVRCSLEGKNYFELAKEANNGQYDLLIMGALGLGAVEGSKVGTVCERVLRRAQLDTLIIKQPARSISDGPIVVAVDGSPKSFGGLLTGIALAQEWAVPLHVISAYDPYYHYVAFNRIAGVLSDEAGKVFRFKEQEKLHEDIIDAGLAKIYEGHLHVADSIATDYDIEIRTKLLDGKPHDVIEKYTKEHQASLLIIGKLGIHADEELDIGGNAENMVRNTDCAVLLTQREYTPRVDVMAEATTSWTHQAESHMEKVPSFARNMARMAILRFAQEKGHTVITESIVKEATAKLCPVEHSQNEDAAADSASNITPLVKEQSFNPDWSSEALAIANAINDQSVRDNLKKRAEKKARQDQSKMVEAEHIRAFLNIDVKQNTKPSSGKCPFGFDASETSPDDVEFSWTEAAEHRLQSVPEGFMRSLTKQRIENWANKQGQTIITPELMESKYAAWGEDSEELSHTMKWDDASARRLQNIPDFVRPMVIKEVERCAKDQGAGIVTSEVLQKASGAWAETGEFHSENNQDLYKK